MPRFTRKSRPIHRVFRDHYIRNSDYDSLNNGGGPINNGIGIIRSSNGFHYKYKYSYDGNNNYLFQGGSGRPCFMLTANLKSKTGVLQSLERDLRGNCSLNSGATTQSAGKAALALAKEVGMIRVELTDNTMKGLPSGKKFSLADMYFLATGKTWYESFLPVRPENSAVIEQSRQIVRQNCWSDVLSCLKSRVPAMRVPVPTDDIDVMAKGSAMKVFERIKKGRSEFFADYGSYLPLCSGIPTLHGQNWIIDII